MSIQSEITRITNNVQDTIDVIEQTGVSVPAGANSDNLPSLAQALANEKQDKLTGTQGQFVGFTADNVVGAVDAPMSVFPVKVSVSAEDQSLSIDKSPKEIYEAYEAGRYVFAVLGVDNSGLTSSYAMPLVLASKNIVAEGSVYDLIFRLIDTNVSSSMSVIRAVQNYDGEIAVVMEESKYDASHIAYNPTGAVNIPNSRSVQSAIYNLDRAMMTEESADAKYFPKYRTVTLPASGWSSNTQTVTVQGVLADETAQLIQPMPAVASQNAYISAGVICSGQAANQLSFTCSTTPTEDISLYVVLTEVQS